MFLRRRDIQPDVIDGMHLFDVLLEIINMLDSAIKQERAVEEAERSSGSKGGSSGNVTVIKEKPGESALDALRAAGYTGFG